MSSSSARPGELRIGDRVRFETRVHTVVGLSGTLVRLADEQGSSCALHLPHLLTSPGFEILEQRPAARVPQAGRLERLPEPVVERAVWGPHPGGAHRTLTRHPAWYTGYARL